MCCKAQDVVLVYFFIASFGFHNALRVRFENDTRSLDCCWQPNGCRGTQKSWKIRFLIEKWRLLRWENQFKSCYQGPTGILFCSTFGSGQLGLTKKSHFSKVGRWARRLCDSHHTGAERKCAVTQKQSTQPEVQWQPPMELPNQCILSKAAWKCWQKTVEIDFEAIGVFLFFSKVCHNCETVNL